MGMDESDVSGPLTGGRSNSIFWEGILAGGLGVAMLKRLGNKPRREDNGIEEIVLDNVEPDPN